VEAAEETEGLGKIKGVRIYVLVEFVRVSCTVVKRPDFGGRSLVKEGLDGDQFSRFEVYGRNTRVCNHYLRDAANLETTRNVEHNT
jgi:hypothetical protein